jgi:agmatine deiminase
MSATLKSRPGRDGFHMPAEFAAHDGCWLLWPERTDNWRLGAKPAQQAFAAVAAAIAAGEPVTVGVSARQYANARATLPTRVRVVELSSNDAWMRDVGPTFVLDGRGRRRGVEWEFNAWGGLYSPWDLDAAVAGKLRNYSSLHLNKQVDISFSAGVGGSYNGAAATCAVPAACPSLVVIPAEAGIQS